MNIRYYRYPTGIQTAKWLAKFTIILLIIIAFIILLLLLFKAHVEQYSNLIGFYIALFFAIVCFAFFNGTWPDIGIDDEGILVEFLWIYLRVPWQDIIEIKHFGSSFFGWWLIDYK